MSCLVCCVIYAACWLLWVAALQLGREYLLSFEEKDEPQREVWMGAESGLKAIQPFAVGVVSAKAKGWTV